MEIFDGKKVYLRLPEENDLDGNWHNWLNNPTVTKYQNKGIFYNTRNMQKEYLQKMERSRNNVLFAIIDKETNEHIGCVGLHDIDWVHRSASLGIIIGETCFWGKGYGRKVWNMITKYGLFVLNLHRIYADVMVENVASIKSAKASGFKEEGIIRHKYYKNGRYHNVVMLSVLKDEFVGVK